MSDGENSPIRQMMKQVSILYVTPGYADKAEEGEPISVVHTAYQRNVEQPILLNLKDTRKLALGLLQALAHHGDNLAETLAEQLRADGTYAFAPIRAEHWRQPEEAPAPPPPPRTCPKLRPTGLVVTARFRDRSVRPIRLHVLGGYSVEDKLMVLYRCTDFGKAVDGIACVEPRRRIRLAGQNGFVRR